MDYEEIEVGTAYQFTNSTGDNDVHPDTEVTVLAKKGDNIVHVRSLTEIKHPEFVADSTEISPVEESVTKLTYTEFREKGTGE